MIFWIPGTGLLYFLKVEKLIQAIKIRIVKIIFCALFQGILDASLIIYALCN